MDRDHASETDGHGVPSDAAPPADWRLPTTLRDTTPLPGGLHWPPSLSTPSPAQLHALYAGRIGDPHHRAVRHASPLERLAARVLDLTLAVVTLGVGWVFWAILLTGEGQTPARMLLGQRVVREQDGAPASLRRLWWGRFVLGEVLFAVAMVLSVGLVVLLPLVDHRRQTFVDKLTGCLVVVDL